MSSSQNTRRRLAFGVAIVLGLVLGIFIKRVHIGLLLGLAIGLLAAGLSKSK